MHLKVFLFISFIVASISPASSNFGPLIIQKSNEQIKPLWELINNNSSLELIEQSIDLLKDINGVDEYSLTPIHHSIISGRLDVFNLLLKKGADINKSDGDGNNPLHIATAVTNGDLFIKPIVKAGVDINIKNNKGLPPLLFHLSQTLSSKTIRLLIEAGADVKITDKDGQNAGVYIVPHWQSSEAIPSLELLVDSGLDINQKPDLGGPILSNAIHYEALEMVRWLVENGADINAYDEYNYTALHEAMGSKYTKVINLLIDLGANVNLSSGNMKPPLITAIYYPNMTVFQKLVAAGADINYIDDDGSGLLHYLMETYDTKPESINYFTSLGLDPNLENYREETPIFKWNTKGNIENLTALVNNGANLSHKADYGYNVLHTLMNDSTSVDAIKTLSDLGADIEATDDGGETVLHRAVSQGNIPVVNFLISKGANINAENHSGETPVFHASINNNDNILKLLSQNGANLEHKNNRGLTPLLSLVQWGANRRKINNLLKLNVDINAVDQFGQNAVMQHIGNATNIKILKLLNEKGVNFDHLDKDNRSLWYYLISKRKPIPPSLIIYMANLLEDQKDNQDINGRTPLYYAVNANKINVIKKLLEIGANFNSSDKNGVQAIHLASRYVQSLEITKSLLEVGADVNAKTKGDRTPLHFAVSNREPNMDLVKYLIEQGADINAKDNIDQTPLTVASKNERYKEAMEYLISLGAK